MKFDKTVKHSDRSGVCRVCGDRAIIINYGALSCQSCKTFFRRNGLQLQTTKPCLRSSSCEINVLTRRNCTVCRLKKCFHVGMNPDLIRKQEVRATTYLLFQLKSFNNPSVLHSYEKKLLSNIIHAIHVHSPILKIKRILKDLSSTTFDSDFNMINIVEIPLLINTSVREFLNSIPDFQILTLFEQRSLLDRNFHAIVNFYSIGIFHDVNLINETYCFKNLMSIYGFEMILNIIHLNKRIDIDLTVIKLMLPVLAFSTNCSIINSEDKSSNDSLLFGTYHLLGSQNIYVDILWKYFLYQYGYFESARRFTQLIKVCLDQITCSHMNHSIHRDLIGHFLHTTKQSLSQNQNEFIPIWGIT